MLVKLTLTLFLSLLIIGCSSDEKVQNIEPKLVVGKKISNLKLSDQFEKVHMLNKDTNRLIFAFSKDAAHTCNDFFNTKEASYLANNHTEFIADVSAAPSLIRSLFIIPGLKDFKHRVLLLDDKVQAAPFREAINTEAIVVVYILNNTITEIKTLQTTEELQKEIEKKSLLTIIAPVINTLVQ